MPRRCRGERTRRRRSVVRPRCRSQTRVHPGRAGLRRTGGMHDRPGVEADRRRRDSSDPGLPNAVATTMTAATPHIVNASASHSWVSTRRLSIVIGAKPATTCAVGITCATPQSATRLAARYAIRWGQEVVLFHSALGLRPAVHEFADGLRKAGHTVHSLDSFEGEVFEDLDEGIRKRWRLDLGAGCACPRDVR
jgi:hypothetical protein